MGSFNRVLVGVASAMTLAAAAHAQPTPNADLGTLSNGTLTGTLTGFGSAARWQWVKLTISGVARVNNDFLDIDTNGGTFSGGDTHIALYGPTGLRIAVDDDDGPSSYSMLSFGSTTSRPGTAPTGNATATGTAHTGQDGANLAAGTYWLAVSGFSTTFSTTTPWGLTSTHTRTGDIAYRISYQYTALPTNPSGTGSWGSSSALNCGNVAVLARVTVTPGTNPTSTGLGVEANLSSIGGSATQRLVDDGTNGDVTAGDNIFSFSQTVESSAAAGSATFGFTITDGQSRTGTGTSSALTVTACPTGACCTANGCVSLTELACAAASGIYRGNGVPCIVPPGYALAGSGSAFEDISGVGTAITTLTDDNAVNTLPLGFTFPFYGGAFTSVNMSSNGYLTFGTVATTAYGSGVTLPAAATPNNAIYALWMDLNCTGRTCHYATLGTAGVDLRFIAQWNNVPRFGQTDNNTFQAVLFENGAVELRYAEVSAAASATSGLAARTGVENSTGTAAASIVGASVVSGAAFRFGVTPATETCVTNPTGAGSLGGPVQNCGNRNALVRVAVTPGLFPASTGLLVTADATSIGGSAAVALNDDGLDGDAVAGDNTFSANVLVPFSAPAGSATIRFAVSDAQGRSSEGSFLASISACTTTGACCLPTGCEQRSFGACGAGGGSYKGDGVGCDVVTYDQVFNSTDTFPIAIPDFAAGTPGRAETVVSSEYAGGYARNIRVCVGLTHTYSGDLIGILSNGTNSAVLFSSQGGSADLGGTYCFASDGTVAFVGGTPSTSSYSTFESLSVFASDPAEGTWTISVSDNAGADVGTIESFSIAFGPTSSICNPRPPCAADYNMDGGVDGADIAAFLGAWETAAEYADVNLDGGIDFADVEFFFSRFEAGGC